MTINLDATPLVYDNKSLLIHLLLLLDVNNNYDLKYALILNYFKCV